MCLALYIASARPLSARPWRENEPGFHVEADPTDRPVALCSDHVAYLGAHTGCSCGFRVDDHDEGAPAGAADRAALCAYLAETLRQGPVSVFIGWEGDQSDPDVETWELAGDEALRPDAWLDLFARGSEAPIVVHVGRGGA